MEEQMLPSKLKGQLTEIPPHIQITRCPPGAAGGVHPTLVGRERDADARQRENTYVGAGCYWRRAVRVEY